MLELKRNHLYSYNVLDLSEIYKIQNINIPNDVYAWNNRPTSSKIKHHNAVRHDKKI